MQTQDKALPEMELLKAELLANVSHELRSPLASIKGYTATLLRHERRISRKERHEFLVAIDEASDRLAAVIDHLLEMAQLETNTISLEYTSVNLAHLIREALTAIEQRPGNPASSNLSPQPSAPLTFTLRLEDEQGRPTHDEPLISADRYRLREVLDHLLENALHYSPQGGTIDVVVQPVLAPHHVKIPISSALEDDEKSNPPWLHEERPMIELRVRDRGIGIPREDLERIFERFRRVDTRLTREVNGLGLGLAICKRIVELHGGVIWAESEEDQGSTFHVLLPMNGYA